MQMSIEAMKQALEALEAERDKYVEWGDEDGAPEDVYEAITSLRQAIAEAEKQDGGCQHCAGKGCVACDARKVAHDVF
jgi:hypothetical protein